MSRILCDMTCRTAEETEAAGARLATEMTAAALPRFVALVGDLGGGKTAFTRGFCGVCCPGANVRSPSFALVNEYRGDPDVFHFDVWRITDEDDLYSTGFYDYADRDGIILCEWADNIDYALPPEYVRVTISGSGNETRKIKIELITD